MSSVLHRFVASSWFLAWLVVLAGSVALTVLVELDLLPDEAPAVREVQSWPFPGETLSDLVRAVTTSEVVVAAGLALVALHWLTRGRLAAVVLLVLVISLPVVQTGVKELVDRPRPVEAGIEERASSTSPSFPAGHVMSPTVVYGWALALVAVRAHRPAYDSAGVHRRHGALRSASALVLAAILALTGIVNVYLGVHWPTDAFGGYLWGLVLLLPALGVYAADRQAR